jgi:hypothetical protein
MSSSSFPFLPPLSFGRCNFVFQEKSIPSADQSSMNWGSSLSNPMDTLMYSILMMYSVFPLCVSRCL